MVKAAGWTLTIALVTVIFAFPKFYLDSLVVTEPMNNEITTAIIERKKDIYQYQLWAVGLLTVGLAIAMNDTTRWLTAKLEYALAIIAGVISFILGHFFYEVSHYFIVQGFYVQEYQSLLGTIHTLEVLSLFFGVGMIITLGASYKKS